MGAPPLDGIDPEPRPSEVRPARAPSAPRLYPQQVCVHDPSDPPCRFRLVATRTAESDYQCAASPQSGDRTSCAIEGTLLSRFSFRGGSCSREIQD
jgi:hypothetical protein